MKKIIHDYSTRKQRKLRSAEKDKNYIVLVDKAYDDFMESIRQAGENKIKSEKEVSEAIHRQKAVDRKRDIMLQKLDSEISILCVKDNNPSSDLAPIDRSLLVMKDKTNEIIKKVNQIGRLLKELLP